MRTLLARLVIGALVAGLAAGAAPGAFADGTEVGGSVPSLLALGLTGGEGLGRIPSASRTRSYDLAIGATVTATESPTVLSVTDGDAAAGRAHGRLATRAGFLAQPLLVRTGKAWTSLAGPGDARVALFPDVLASKRAAIGVRQRVPARTSGAVAPKTLLVTLSVEGP